MVDFRGALGKSPESQIAEGFTSTFGPSTQDVIKGWRSTKKEALDREFQEDVFKKKQSQEKELRKEELRIDEAYKNASIEAEKNRLRQDKVDAERRLATGQISVVMSGIEKITDRKEEYLKLLNKKFRAAGSSRKEAKLLASKAYRADYLRRVANLEDAYVRSGFTQEQAKGEGNSFLKKLLPPGGDRVDSGLPQLASSLATSGGKELAKPANALEDMWRSAFSNQQYQHKEEPTAPVAPFFGGAESELPFMKQLTDISQAFSGIGKPTGEYEEILKAFK